MKKFLIWQNKWFTLVELLVSITIIVIISGGIFFYFDVIASGLKNITFKSKTFQDIELLEKFFQDSIKDYTHLLALEGNIFPEASHGFSILVLSNEEKNAWFLWGSYDTSEKKIVFWNIDTYKIYHPAFVTLSESDIALVESDITNFLSSLPEDKIQYFKNISLTKWGIYQILSPKMMKIDFVMSFEKYSDFIWLPLKDVQENPRYKTIKISMIY